MAFLEGGPPNHEQVIVSVRPHWYGLVGPTLKVVVVLLLAVVGVSFLSNWPETRTIRYIVVAVAVILLFRYSVPPWLRWRTTLYVLTTERLVISAGVLRRSAADMPLSHVGEVESRSSLIENLFGCGTLIVSSRDGRDVFELPRMPKVSDVGSTLHRLAHGAGW